MMKQTGMMGALIATVAQAALENCLYCRYTDLQATFLESWSYCNGGQECLADQWNYIDRDCSDGSWNRAAKLSLDDCQAETAPCPEFTSSKQYDLGEPLGRHRNLTWVLPSGSKCTVKIDSTNYIGRVLFDNIQGYLGVEDQPAEWDISQKITSPVGETKEVLIYNAAESGSLRFTISFSGASSLVSSTAAAMLAVAALTQF